MNPSLSLLTANLPKREVNLQALVDGLGQEITWVERRQLVPGAGILEATSPRVEFESNVDVTGGSGSVQKDRVYVEKKKETE